MRICLTVLEFPDHGHSETVLEKIRRCRPREKSGFLNSGKSGFSPNPDFWIRNRFRSMGNWILCGKMVKHLTFERWRPEIWGFKVSILLAIFLHFLKFSNRSNSGLRRSNVKCFTIFPHKIQLPVDLNRFRIRKTGFSENPDFPEFQNRISPGDGNAWFFYLCSRKAHSLRSSKM